MIDLVHASHNTYDPLTKISGCCLHYHSLSGSGLSRKKPTIDRVRVS